MNKEKTCNECNKLFLSTGHNQYRCVDCQKRISRRRAQNRQNKKRIHSTRPKRIIDPCVNGTQFSDDCKCNSCRQNRKRAMWREMERRKKERRAGNPWWVVRRRMSGMLRTVTTKRYGAGCKWGPTFSTLGYTPDDLRRHLESLFVFGMGWNNVNEWHIDHIKPVSWFKKLDNESIKKAWSLDNLQPRWATTDIANKYGGFMEGNTNKGARYAG